MNNLKVILKTLGIRNKFLADRLSITPQALNTILNARNTIKHNARISEILNIGEFYITKQELTEEDKKEILRQFHKMDSNNKKISKFKHDEVITLNELVLILNEWRYEDIDKLVVEIEQNGMYIPEFVFEDAEISIDNNKKVEIFSDKIDQLLSFNLDIIDSIVKRWYNPLLKRLIIALKNGVVLKITRVYYDSEAGEDL